VHLLPALPPSESYVPLTLAVLLTLRFRAARTLLPVVAAFVWTAHCAQLRLAERLVAPGDFAVTGWIDDFPVAAPGQVTFSLHVDAPRPAGVPERVRMTWYDAPKSLAAGVAVKIVARLKPPRGLRNPGGFDYERWLMLENYGATGYVRSGAVVPDARVSGSRAWLQYRARLAARIAAASPDADAAALMVALAIGERFMFADRHWTDFRRTGTSHLVAVSGLHVGLLGLVLFVAVRWLWLRAPIAAAVYDLEAAAAASALGTLYYAALTGFAVPAQRSAVMIITALALAVSRRSVGAGQSLAAALLAVTIWDPFAPLSGSFWLSFAAVAVLLRVAAARSLRAAASRRWRRLAAGAYNVARLQWSISWALLPLVAAFFAEVSLVGPAVNLIAIPWFSLVLVPAALAITVVCSQQWLAALVGGPLINAAGVLADYTVAALHACSAGSWAAVHLAPPGWLALAVAVGGVALALPSHPLPGRRLAWLALLPLALPLGTAPPRGAAQITLLDVGHGLAVIVATRGHRLLYDAGPRYPSGYDAGASVVVPALRAERRFDLDRVIVSHGDNDHAGGVRRVLDEFPQARVLAGPDVVGFSGDPCARGQRWLWDGVEFAILHPPTAFEPRGNDSSCVLRVAAGGHAVLIAGDIEARAERALPRERLSADVVIVPHHGSATSSTTAFVAATHPVYALVSAGFGNRWGFPSRVVRRRWAQVGAALLVTGDVGAVTVALGPDGLTVSAERARWRRYWNARP
jgi:competence protein ComEC